MEREIEKVRSSFQASLQMLDTLEASLEPMLDDDTGEFELASTFRDHTRNFVEGLLAADRTVSSAEEEAYEVLFDESLSEMGLKAYADEADYEDAVGELLGFLDWIAGLEAKITDLLDEKGGAVEGLTASLIDTLEMLGMSLFLDDEENTDRAVRLKKTIESCRTVARDHGLDAGDSVFEE